MTSHRFCGQKDKLFSKAAVDRWPFRHEATAEIHGGGRRCAEGADRFVIPVGEATIEPVILNYQKDGSA
jgi:hypothetical protein